MSEKFNQAKYIQQYKKEHYKIFKVELKHEENEELENMLKEDNKTKAQFLRESIEKYKKERGK